MGILDRCLPAAMLLKDDGSKIYSRAFLWIYDFNVLWLNNNFAWHCSTDKVLFPLYRSAMGPDHLEIGVGTGYYPAEALKLGHPCRRITLVDLNAATLDAASHRIASARPVNKPEAPSNSISDIGPDTHSSASISSSSSSNEDPASDSSQTSHPSSSSSSSSSSSHPTKPPSPSSSPSPLHLRTILANAMHPLPLPAHEKFDSISIFHLLHCIPLTPDQKTRIFDLARQRLRPTGILVGSTILGEESPRNRFAEFNMRVYNRSGVFHNWADTRDVFERGLRRNFEDVEVEVVGRVMTWRARRPRTCELS